MAAVDDAKEIIVVMGLEVGIAVTSAAKVVVVVSAGELL